jgi:hypothetical protein
MLDEIDPLSRRECDSAFIPQTKIPSVFHLIFPFKFLLSPSPVTLTTTVFSLYFIFLSRQSPEVHHQVYSGSKSSNRCMRHDDEDEEDESEKDKKTSDGYTLESHLSLFSSSPNMFCILTTEQVPIYITIIIVSFLTLGLFFLSLYPSILSSAQR